MSFTTAEEQIKALREPFDPSLVKFREQGGQQLAYYEAHTIQQRLLDVLGPGLSITTVRTEITDDRVDMEVKLTIRWVDGTVSEVSGWGSSDIMRARSNNRIVNDAFKAANTDAIKVAASKLGVAAELYDKAYRETLTTRNGDRDRDRPAPRREAPAESEAATPRPTRRFNRS